MFKDMYTGYMIHGLLLNIQQAVFQLYAGREHVLQYIKTDRGKTVYLPPPVERGYKNYTEMREEWNNRQHGF
jgi:hypothetical protein